MPLGFLQSLFIFIRRFERSQGACLLPGVIAHGAATPTAREHHRQCPCLGISVPFSVLPVALGTGGRNPTETSHPLKRASSKCPVALRPPSSSYIFLFPSFQWQFWQSCLCLCWGERTVSTDRQHRAVYRPARGAEPYHPTDSLCSLQSLSCTDFFFVFP